MNKLTLGIFATAALVAVGCKTTEANYKAAYEAAVASREPSMPGQLDENTRRLLAMDRKNAHTKTIVDGDTLEITQLFVSMESNEPKRVPQYSVVANAFSQIFNAQALQKRLIEAGFPNAYIFKTATPDYYVAADGSNDIANIPQITNKLNEAGNPGSRAGFPVIIRSAGYRPQ